MGSAARIIDLAAYRQQRVSMAAPAAAPALLPVVFVPVWAYVPVVVIAGYY